MGDERTKHSDEQQDGVSEERRPIGALAVVGVLTVFILAFWLFTYFLHLGRG